MPALGSSIPFGSKITRVPMEFTDNWGEGETFDWYRRLRKSNSSEVKSLQVRVDRGKPPHRFVLAHLDNGTVWRFDRRPETGNLGTLLFETVLPASHRHAADDRCFVPKEHLIMITAGSICEIEVNLPPGTDLLLVISVCFSISQDREARYYDLLKYNCYFFSWTIILVVTRHTFPFSVPSPSDIAKYLEPKRDGLARSLTNKTVKVLLGIVLNVITAIRVKTDSTIQDGMSFGNRIVWKLPPSSMRFVLHQVLKMQMHLGLKDLLYSKMRDQVASGENDLLADLWEKRVETNKQVEQRLWVQKLADDFKPKLEEKLVRIIWDLILDMVAAVQAGDGSEPLAFGEQQKNRSHIKSLIFGDAQWIHVWNEALKMGLPAARDAAHGQSGPLQPIEPATDQENMSRCTAYRKLHGDSFEIAFKAASGASLEGAQRAVRETEDSNKNPKTAAMWVKIWEVWDTVWGVANQTAKDGVVRIVEQGVEEIIELVTGEVVTTVGEMYEQNTQILVKHRTATKTIEGEEG
ncbi:hypothetical protein RhiTH_007973 [Rhizoctonia solani]